jgi:outer membrane receptor protein involved in Fe transport
MQIGFRNVFAGLALAASVWMQHISAQQAPSQQGTVIGQIFDASNGQPIPLVTISIDGQTATGLQSDTDGRFQIKLSPGVYKLKFTSDKYVETTVDAVEVKAGEVVDSSTVMQVKGAVTTVEVNEKVGAVASNAEALLTERKLAQSVSDGISSEEIRKSVASDAAGAVEKVTGVSIVDSGYVYVRGLGERYSSTMLNNAVIPTTEPERRVVPLDLFPAALIDTIKILKTYTPDLPGEFAGGLVQMTTTEFPSKPTLRVGVSYGFNTRTTAQRFQTYSGGSRDVFGFDDGRRNSPIPDDQFYFPAAPGVTPESRQQAGRSFRNDWELGSIESMRPSQTYNIVGANTYGRIGLVGALTFTNAPQRYQEQQSFLTSRGPNDFFRFSNYPDFNYGQENTRLGGVLNAAIRINAANKIVFRNTLTRDSEKEARVFQGLYGSTDSIIRSERRRWIERGLVSTGVEGEHSVAKMGNSLFRWQFTYSQSKRDEPDYTETIRSQNEDGSFRWTAFANSGLRFFNYLQDRIYEPQGEWAKPFFKGSFSGLFKVGFRGTIRRRDFDARRFRFQSGTLPFNVLNLPTNQLFAPENIRPGGLTLQEDTRSTDGYTASLDIYGGYAMVDLNLTPKLRLITGVRVEDAQMNVTTINRNVPGAIELNSNLSNRDPLPSVNVIYALTPRQNIRAAYGRTVSRPDFRELSPFEFNAVLGGVAVFGNRDLKRAAIDNVDLRWEWFLGGDQVVAASYFYKKFTDPIEIYLQPTTGDLRQSFFNAAGANNQGIELEMRKGLGFASQKLKDFGVGGNFTFVTSDVDLSGTEPLLVALTSRSRPLVGQSRFIFNVIADWARPQWRSNARFLANSVSRRITDVGTFGLPDIYQERNTFLDFVYQYDLREDGKWTLRFSAENLADNHYRWVQGNFTVRDYRIGRSFTIGTSYSFF